MVNSYSTTDIAVSTFEQQAPQGRASWARGSRRGRRSGRRVATLLGAATLLAGAALLQHRKTRQAEEDWPPAGRFIRVDGVRLHYVDRGEGRPVLFLHGNGASIEDFEASGLLARAAGKYRVIAIDRPGFGHSDRPRATNWTPTAQAELIHKAISGLGVERPIVVGHSWGTMVALAFALDHPEDVAALVLLSGYYFPTVRADVPLLSPPAIPVIGDVMRHTVSPWLGRLIAPALIRRIFAPAPVSESFADFPIELSLRPSQIRAAAGDTALMVPAAAALSQRYGEIDVPTVIVAGSGDKIADFGRQSRHLARAIKDSELNELPGIGHMIHHSAPDRVMAAIDRAVELADERLAPAAAPQLVEAPA